MGTGKFFASFETKHLVISIACAVAGWGGSQIYTIGIQQAAMNAYQLDHHAQLVELNTLPPKMAVVESTIMQLISNDEYFATELRDDVYTNTSRINVLETVTGGVRYE